MSTAEVMVGATLSLVALGALYSVFSAQQKALAAQNIYNQAQSETRAVIDLMSRELRMAAYDPTGAALTTSTGPACPGVKQGLDEATPTRIRFRQDLDGDGTITGASESITYEVVNDELRRTDGAATPVAMASGLPQGGFSFRYFTGGNPPVELVPGGSPAALTAAQRDCVARVQVTLTASFANPDPNNPRRLTSQVSSEVAIRNRSLANF
jgi:type II secretory pathway component PulJ